MKQIAYNKYALYEYFVIEKLEAGIALEGAEVKALRAGNCNLKDSFCLLRNGELTLKNMHIPVYDKAGAFSSKDSKRDRRLLLHRSELDGLREKSTKRAIRLCRYSCIFREVLSRLKLRFARASRITIKNAP